MNPKGQVFQVIWLTLESVCEPLSVLLSSVPWGLVILDLLSLAALILLISFMNHRNTQHTKWQDILDISTASFAHDVKL